MITTTALEAWNRARAERPVALVITRRRSAASDAAVRALTAAARLEDVDALALDVDDPQNSAFLDEMQVELVPEVLVVARGVVLERCGVHDADDASAVLSAALRRTARRAAR
jgi:hypothetical protein